MTMAEITDGTKRAAVLFRSALLHSVVQSAPELSGQIAVRLHHTHRRREDRRWRRL